VFENSLLRRIFGPNRDEDKVEEQSCTMWSFKICTNSQISSGRSNQGEYGERGIWHAWERRRKVYTVLVGNPEGKRPLERQRHR
jgi:hypothetical protein